MSSDDILLQVFVVANERTWLAWDDKRSFERLRKIQAKLGGLSWSMTRPSPRLITRELMLITSGPS